MTYTVKDILKIEVAPALGCTEPVAIALGAAAAASLLPDKTIDFIEIWVDPNIYKNGLAVSIPGTKGLVGLDTASAVGALGGDPALKLEVLEPINEEVVTKVQDFLKAGKVKVNLLAKHKGLYIRTVLKSGADTAESVIRDLHDNIVSLKKNGKQVTESELLPQKPRKGNKSELLEMETWLKGLSLENLIELLDDLDDEDRKFIEDLAGVICDGAKAGCALKLATAAGTAVQAALFSLQGVNVLSTDGIIGHSPEQTMQNIGTLSTQGMIETDRTILKIMLAKQFSVY